jgi:serine phosphatase RsbU (regulator of sigma subunit)
MPLPLECVALFHQLEGRIFVPAGEVILQEGQQGGLMYMLSSGQIKISLQGTDIDYLEAGDVFGEMTLLAEQTRSATVTATTDCVAIPVDNAQFASLIRRHPDLAVEVMRTMSTRMRRSMIAEVTKVRMEQELAVGHRIQLSLLPGEAPLIAGWEFASFYQAAREVGGDLYDYIPGPSDSNYLSIVVADVTGKGVPAALLMAVSRTLMRVEARYGHGPAAVLQRTNEMLMQDSQTLLLVTAFFASLDTESGEMRFASAGHDPAIWLCGASGEIRALRARGMLLGAFRNIPVEEKTQALAPGDAVIFYTDGLTEARDAEGGFLDLERVQAAIAGAHGGSAQDIVDALMAEVHRFTGDEPQSDDLTIVVVRRLP